MMIQSADDTDKASHPRGSQLLCMHYQKTLVCSDIHSSCVLDGSSSSVNVINNSFARHLIRHRIVQGLTWMMVAHHSNGHYVHHFS